MELTAKQYLEQKRLEVVETAETALAGQLGLIEGSRRLTSLMRAVSKEEHDPDFLVFIEIDSDSDHLPIGGVREFWSAKALRKVDKEIELFETSFKKDFDMACKKILARFKDAT